MGHASVSRETPPAPEGAAAIFGDRLATAEQYATLLAGAARERGLMGPREVPRIWERHLLNCAAMTGLVGTNASVCDVGSGAGLPGLAMAIRRPDLRITLLEPLLRRTTFLEEAVQELGLTNVEVVRGRAEALHGHRTFDVVTSRAVAGLSRLLEWSLPLATQAGVVLAMKGETADGELAEAAETISRLDGRNPEVVLIREIGLPSPTTVVRVEAGASGPIRCGAAPRRAPRSARRRPNQGR